MREGYPDYAAHTRRNGISEAVGERIAREKRERVFKEIMEGQPSFTDVADSVAYVRELRAADEKRMQRLGI